jgi:hypothetical protein
LRTTMLSSLELPKKSLRLIIPNRLRVVKPIISDHFNACVRKMILSLRRNLILVSMSKA